MKGENIVIEYHSDWARTGTYQLQRKASVRMKHYDQEEIGSNLIPGQGVGVNGRARESSGPGKESEFIWKHPSDCDPQMNGNGRGAWLFFPEASTLPPVLCQASSTLGREQEYNS